MMTNELTPFTKKKDQFTISTDKHKLDLDVIQGYLYRSYWKAGVPKDHTAKSLEHALCFGLYDGQNQIGFARVITDYLDFAYICDVFVLKTYQGQGLGGWMLEAILDYLSTHGVRSLTLATSDAHEFYRKYGFQELDNPDSQMLKVITDRVWYNPKLIANPPQKRPKR
ncbi:MAG: GNAT family N-acetyltransferase [Chloroflexota bacterium]